MYSNKIKTDLDLLKRMERKYRSIPMEAIIKQDLLRRGINFSKESLQSKTYKSKDYFIFTFDHLPLKEIDSEIISKAPEEIKIKNGYFSLKPTVVSTRNNIYSPYKVKLNPEGKIVLFLQDQELTEVEFHPLPSWYEKKTKNGKLPGEIAPVIEWGYLIYLTVFRNCQYFGKEEECAFCDINHNYKQQKQIGRPYTGVKTIEDILEVLSWIDKEDTVSKVYTITGGSILTKLKKKKEVDFYLEYAQAIENKFSGRWMGKIVTQAFEKEDCQKFKDVGIQVYHPNYEVWEPYLFEKLCPGKASYIGRENWIRRILDSAEVFGPSHVIPNFVGGVELSKPYGYNTIKEGICSTQKGLNFFMSKKIMPRFTTWCPEPYTTLGTQESPPLEYFCELLTVWKQTFEKYNLPIPPGYGEAGVGKAVFSVSAFMDVIGYKDRV